MAHEKHPSIGTTIYVTEHGYVEEFIVKFLGEDTFLCPDGLYDFKEFYYVDSGLFWFETKDEAERDLHNEEE